jgi:NADH-quinone oxidoreductase subunit L
MTGDMLINYALGILFFPLISFIILIFVGKRLPRQGDIIGIGTIILTLILSLAMFGSMLLKHS